ncbi:uncharacterized protein LOC118479205 [Aplysia californica]|uniref:Uncharacterized protein LOC118479205 n=1 Tax=Aplysia californica TaxID=6500 RepID=A0ABM1W5E5_APLCA|nr:uncharacterized protein LOC118479205 [Aplysia californica]XP_035829889.1 uncharacterized protein LOC118479205 [Aplysia californica]
MAKWYGAKGVNIDDQARFESMGRGLSTNRQIFQRHRDLNRQCEKQIQHILRESRIEASRLTRVQHEYKEKIKELEKAERNSLAMNFGEPSAMSQNLRRPTVGNFRRHPSPHRKQKRMLLFRIEKTDGKLTYISEVKKPDPLERTLFPNMRRGS